MELEGNEIDLTRMEFDISASDCMDACMVGMD